MSDRIVALIRTTVPVAVGAAITWASKKLGVEIDTAGVAAAAVTISTGAYYFVASSLERKWPVFGVLLGVPAGAPTYHAARSSTTFEEAPTAAFDIGKLLPPGTVITVPAVATPSLKKFTLTVGPDGAEIVSNEPDPSASAPNPEVTQ